MSNPERDRADVAARQIGVEQVGDDAGSPVANTSSGIFRLVRNVWPGSVT